MFTAPLESSTFLSVELVGGGGGMGGGGLDLAVAPGLLTTVVVEKLPGGGLGLKFIWGGPTAAGDAPGI